MQLYRQYDGFLMVKAKSAPSRKFGQGRKRHGRGNCCSSSSQGSSGHICTNCLPSAPDSLGLWFRKPPRWVLGWAPYPPGASVLPCQLHLSSPQLPPWEGAGGRRSLRLGGGPGTPQHSPEAGPSPGADQGVDGTARCTWQAPSVEMEGTARPSPRRMEQGGGVGTE